MFENDRMGTAVQEWISVKLPETTRKKRRSCKYYTHDVCTNTSCICAYFSLNRVEADGAVITLDGKDISCFAVDGAGKYGWCKVRTDIVP
jgi:hypothetical protein